MPGMSVSPKVHQVIYSSAEVVPFSENDLSTLLLRARSNNERLGVTGLLLYHEGSFLQALEGDEAVLDALFTTISRDKRHNRVVKLLGRAVEERHFSNWKMGFVAMSTIAKTLPGFSDYLRQRGELAGKADAATRVLSAFRDGRFHNHVAV
jgi:Sensors of blue-light using FAD